MRFEGLHDSSYLWFEGLHGSSYLWFEGLHGSSYLWFEGLHGSSYLLWLEGDLQTLTSLRILEGLVGPVSVYCDWVRYKV